MPHRYTFLLLLTTVLPLCAVATAFSEDRPAEPPVPKPAKLDRKNYTEKVSGFKMEVVDPDSNPPKMKKLEMPSKV